jgi:RNA polymerase primary sigma factor
MAHDSKTSIKIYLREIMQTPLLTTQQEIELAARIKKGDRTLRFYGISTSNNILE